MKGQLFGVSAAIGAATLGHAGHVGDISCTKGHNELEILVQGTGLAKPKTVSQVDKKTLVLEFDEKDCPPAGEFKVGSYGINYVNWKQEGSVFKLTVVMEDKTPDYKLVSKDGGWAIKFTSSKMAAPTIHIHTVGDSDVDESKAPLQASTNPDVPKVVSTEPTVKVKAPKAAAPTATKTTAVKATTVTKKADAETTKINLEFSHADVTQVLKALSMQAGVNVISSPDVKNANISVSLEQVSVKEALDYITALANLRYAKVNNTYLVATAGKFNDLMKSFNSTGEEAPSSRVVPIFSGKGSQVKETLFKSIPIESTQGHYDILLPNEETTIKKKETLGDSDKLNAANAMSDALGGGKAGGAPSDTGSSIETKASASDKPQTVPDNYVLVVGSRNILDTVEAEVRRVDREICRAMLITVPDERVASSDVYRCMGTSGKALLAAVCEPENAKNLATQPFRTKVGNVVLYANDAPSGADQIVIMQGPRHEVDQLKGILSQLDNTQAVSSSVQIYEVKYRDPRSLKDDLTAQIPGLRVSIAPITVSTPQLYNSGSVKSDVASQALNSQQGSQQSSSQQGQAPQSTGTGIVGGGKADVDGIDLPFSNLENSAMPMKLVLRGNEQQIKNAVDYLQMVDTPPKMVALEVRVMELTKEDSVKAGLDWNMFTGGAVKFIRLNNSQASANNSAGFHINSGGISGDVITQLDQIATKSNLIARPNVLATDGRQTEIFVGDVIRYIESIISTQNGVTVTTGTVRVGVRVSVMPRVGGDNAITMDLRPVVSYLKGFTEVKAIQGQLPQTSERMSQQTVSMKSGETIAIGGLIQDQDRTDITGVPLLMNIPLFGNLFKSTTHTKDRTELVIFISAKALEGPVGAGSTAIPMQNSKNKIEFKKGDH